VTAALVLRAGDARVAVDLDAGGRLSSLTLGGLELLGRGGPEDIDWGCYVMAPYAGRVREGRLHHGGAVHQLPVNHPPHAIHGVTFDRPWTVVERRGAAEAALLCPLDERWPFEGTVLHRLALTPHGLALTVTVTAVDRPFPAAVGWHPWFRRRLDHGGAVEIDLRAGAMLARDADGITTPIRTAVPEGPWDDCFVDVQWPVGLSWPGALHLDVWSDAEYVVVFDGKPDAVCVEPQTGPPDGINTAPRVVTSGSPLVSQMRLAWATG
jgi:galactose mutarotase-like enzyme